MCILDRGIMHCIMEQDERGGRHGGPSGSSGVMSRATGVSAGSQLPAATASWMCGLRHAAAHARTRLIMPMAPRLPPWRILQPGCRILAPGYFPGAGIVGVLDTSMDRTLISAAAAVRTPGPGNVFLSARNVF